MVDVLGTRMQALAKLGEVGATVVETAQAGIEPDRPGAVRVGLR